MAGLYENDMDREQLRQALSGLRKCPMELADDPDNNDGIDFDQLAEAQKLFGLDGESTSETDQLQQLLEKVNGEIVQQFEPAALTGKDLVTAGRQPLQNNPNSWEVTLSFNSDGAEAFAELTKSIAGTDRLLGIVLDGQAISEASVGPQFQAAGISGGSASISGNFTAEELPEVANFWAEMNMIAKTAGDTYPSMFAN